MQGLTRDHVDDAEVPDVLRAHWREWTGATADEVGLLGATHPGAPPVVVVGASRRTRSGWDGDVHPVTGVVDPAGAAVVSLPPEHADWGRELVAKGAGIDRLRAALPTRLGLPDHVVYRAVCRWSARPSDVPSIDVLPDAGAWIPVEDPRVPDWLRPFGGEVLVALDGDRYLAGVGLKRHDRFGHEIAVGTDDHARGRGLARRLVAQATRSLHAEGIVATYLHDPANTPSARVADAAGLPDRGWGVLGIAPIPS